MEKTRFTPQIWRAIFLKRKPKRLFCCLVSSSNLRKIWITLKKVVSIWNCTVCFGNCRRQHLRTRICDTPTRHHKWSFSAATFFPGVTFSFTPPPRFRTPPLMWWLTGLHHCKSFYSWLRNFYSQWSNFYIGLHMTATVRFVTNSKNL